MFDSVIRSVVAEEYHTVFIIVQTDLGHLFALKHGSGSTSPDVVTSLEIYVLLARANLPTLQLHRKREILVEVFKSVNKMSPSFMWDLFKVKDITYNLRSNRNVCFNHCRTKRYGLDSLSYYGAHLWNLLPNDMKKCKDLDIFKTCVRNWKEHMCKCRMCMQ